MNKREKAILTRLYWLIAEYKNEHHVLYYSKDVLQSVLRKEYTIAENLVNNKIVGESIIVPPKPLHEVHEVHEDCLFSGLICNVK